MTANLMSRLLGGTILAATSILGAGSASAAIFTQCPGDTDGIVSTIENPIPGRNIVCKHLTGGDGFINMPDIDPNTGQRRRLYMFGFSDVSDVAPADVPVTGQLNANFPAPPLVFEQGQEAYVTLSNVGMIIRPDLFDPHTIHWHGFPNAASVFDGVPEASISINQVASLTYYYNVVEPGTFMYHCHVEAAEHMQMGMLGSLYVHAAQDQVATGDPVCPSCAYTKQGDERFAYNDRDGTTGYDVEYPIQIGSMDPIFHDASEGVQPLPFADMEDKYPMLNGRGYPETLEPGSLFNTADEPKASQNENALIVAQAGQRILLRISNLNVTRFYTLASPSIPMRVVGNGSRLYRGGGVATTGLGANPNTLTRNLSFETTAVTLGGGEAIDVILDTTDVPPGTYVLQTNNLNYLSNNFEDFGGMMTEIVIQ